MPIIQTPSIAAVVEDQNPNLAADLSCNDHVLQDVGGVNWYDASVEYTANVQFGTSLYFQPSAGNGTYVFRGSSSTRLFQAQVTSTDVILRSGTTNTKFLTRTENASAVLQWNAGSGSTANMVLDTSTLELRNSTSSMQVDIYNTYTDASNYERAELKWDSNIFKIETAHDGTGSSRRLELSGNEIRIRQQNSLVGRWASGSLIFSSGNEPRPSSDGGSDLGTDSFRWGTTYTHGIATDVETFTATSDTLDRKNNVALCDCTSNNITINMPPASTASGLQYHIKKTDASANTVTIDGNGSETIDGAATQTISSQYDSITVVSDGSDWFII